MAKGKMMKKCYVVIMIMMAASGLYLFSNGRFKVLIKNKISTDRTNIEVASKNETSADRTHVEVPVKDKWSTNRKKVELTIRMPVTKIMLTRFFCWMLRSAVLFWNKDYGDVVIILDEEDRKTNFTRKLKSLNLAFNFRFVYENMPYNSNAFDAINKKIVKRNVGYVRQLYSSFFMDLYTSPDSVIAWIDTDGAFTMPVVERSIFKDGKLIVHGYDTFNRIAHVAWWVKSTKAAIGLPMVADFMTYFPVYIYAQTIKNCRDYIVKHLKVKNMEEAFVIIANTAFVSPVNVIMSYAYYFERQRYDWHIDIGLNTPENLERFNKNQLPKNHSLLPSDSLTELHVAVHAGYYYPKIDSLQQAICYTHIHLGNKNLPHCEVFKDKPNWVPFLFEPRVDHAKSWCIGVNLPRCVSMVNDRYKMFVDLFRQGKFPLDVQKIKAIEDVAAKHYQVKCTSIITAPFS